MKELGNRTHERSDENPDKRLDEDSSELVLTAANALTFLRIIAIPIVLLLLLEGEDAFAVTVFVVAAATDFLDGRLARRRGGSGTTYLDMILDPVADRLMLSSVAVVLAEVSCQPPSWRSSLGGTSWLFWELRISG